MLSVRYNQERSRLIPAGLSSRLVTWVRRHPFVRLTAAKGRRQYLAHNIMHRQSHQSPQCRTLTVNPSTCLPGWHRERRGEEGGETEKQTIITSRIACLSSLRAAWEDFSFQIVKWGRINERIYKERSGILPLSSTSKRTFLSRSGGEGRGGEKIARQTRLSVPSLSPNITDLMKSNYSRVSEGKTVTETSFITEKQEPVIEEYGYH